MEQDVFDGILKASLQKDASDIHLQVGSPPIFRLHGELVKVHYPELQPRDTRAIVECILRQASVGVERNTLRDLDISYSLAGVGRFRASIFRQQGTFSIVLRAMPPKVPSLRELSLPIAVQEIAELRRGLVLVAGLSGMGKSTTLAAILEHINQDRCAHIITIEDPIEFLLTPKTAVISQREIGNDTADFVGALRAALRQDPDVLLVSDIPDAQALDMVLRAAENGHLVFGAFHASDVGTTIDRLISFYPDHQRRDGRGRLAENLMGIVALRLLINREGTSRIPAVEIMRSHPEIQERLLDPTRTKDIPAVMSAHPELGMQTLDQHILELYQRGAIGRAVALQQATNPSLLEQAFGGDGNPADSDEIQAT